MARLAAEARPAATRASSWWRRPASSASSCRWTRLAAGIRRPRPALRHDGGADAARAIMTTDPFPKEAAAEGDGRAADFRVGGMAKGSGMIEPMMATMLGFVTTDAGVEPALLQRALNAAVDDTFNAIRSTASARPTIACSCWPMARAACSSARRSIRCSSTALTRSAAAGDRHRTRRRGRDQADDDQCHRRETDQDAKTAAGRSPTRRSSRRRFTAAIRTGAGSSPSPGAPARTLVLDRAAVRIGPVELFNDGAPYDERARKRPIPAGKDIDHGGRSRHRRQRPSADVVVRSDRGVRRINAEYRTMSSRLNAPPADISCWARSSDRAGTGTAAQGSAGKSIWRRDRFLSILDFDAPQLEACLAACRGDEAARAAGLQHVHPLEGKHVALLFEKPSLRTRSTFQIAVRELGGEPRWQSACCSRCRRTW